MLFVDTDNYAHNLQIAKNAVVKFLPTRIKKMTQSAEQMMDESVLTWCNEVVEFLGQKWTRAQHPHHMGQITSNNI